MTATSDLTEWIEDSRVERDPQGDQLGISNTWVSPGHRYFYMATPKVACSKIKLVLQELEGYEVPPAPLRIHWRDTPGLSFVPSLADLPIHDAVRALTSPDWFRFAFVRNPYARLLSAYTQKVRDLNSPWVGFREAVRRSAGVPTVPGAAPAVVEFPDFVRYIGEQDDGVRDGHWRSQVGTLHVDRIRYDFVGRFESFTEDLTHVLRKFRAPDTLLATVGLVVNATARVPLTSVYDQDLADYVYRVFRDDFEAFEYHRNDWTD